MNKTINCETIQIPKSLSNKYVNYHYWNYSK